MLTKFFSFIGCHYILYLMYYDNFVNVDKSHLPVIGQGGVYSWHQSHICQGKNDWAIFFPAFSI